MGWIKATIVEGKTDTDKATNRLDAHYFILLCIVCT